MQKYFWKRIVLSILFVAIWLSFLYIAHKSHVLWPWDQWSFVHAQGASAWVGAEIGASASATALIWSVGASVGQSAAEAQASAKYIKTVETILKVVYLFMWPFLSIAWAALDNTLVYGQIFYLDTTLRKFRNIMRSFANYTLWFLFVGAIWYSFIKQDAQIIKKVIQRLVISVLLVNMSWWLMAAMIDISTIAIVNFGALPLVAIGEAEEDPIFNHTRYLKSHSYMNRSESTNETQDQVSEIVIHSCAGEENPKKYFLPCWIENNKMIPEWAFGAREPQTWDEYAQRVVDARPAIEWSELTRWMINDKYCVFDNKLITNQFGDDASVENLMKWEAEAKESEAWLKCLTLNDIIVKAEKTSGPLYTLYGSILSMSHIALTPNTWSIRENSLEMLVKAAVWIALIIPLIALAVALLIRVVFLWAFIAFVPLLILAYVFEFKQIDSAMWWKFSMWTVVWLIFLPVFAVFALSVSILFLTLLQNISFIEDKVWPSAEAPVQPDWLPNDMLTAFMWEDVKRNCSDTAAWACCYNFLDIVEVCVTESQRRTWANIALTIPWIVWNVFWIILMRVVIFAVLKSNAITKWAVETIEGFAKKALGTIPIIPVWGWIGLWSAQQAIKEMKTNIPREIQQRQYEQTWIPAMLQWFKSDIAWTPKQQSKNLKGQIQDGNLTLASKEAKWTENNNFNDYNSLVPAFGEQIAKDEKYANAGRARNWSQAFRNEDFVRYLQDNDSYNTDFFNRWEQTRVPERRERSFRMMEDGMKSITDDENTFELPDREDGTRVHYYLHNWNLVRFSGKWEWNDLEMDSEEISALSLRNPLPDTNFASQEEAEALIQVWNDYGSLEDLQASPIARVFGPVLQDTSWINTWAWQATITINNEQRTFNVPVEDGQVRWPIDAWTLKKLGDAPQGSTQ